MSWSRTEKKWTLVLIALGSILVWSYWPEPAPPRPPELRGLARVEGSRVLRVATVNSPATWYLRHNRNRGLEYELARAFAEHLGVELQIIRTSPFAKLFDNVLNNQADMAASAITVTAARQQRLLFSEPYRTTTQQVIYRAGNLRPRSVNDLVGRRIVVIADSSYEESLLAMRESTPELDWSARTDAGIEDLFEAVTAGSADLTLADSTITAMHLRFYPHLKVAFDLGEEQPIAWAFAAESQRLRDAATAFLMEFRDSGRLERVVERYHGHIAGYNRVNTHYFLRHVQTRLPRYQETFERVAAEHGLDWRMLAAIAYQESQWDPDAVSRTGVRGMMMLTRATAAEMGISNRRDATQSIEAGAAYVIRMKQRIPARIQEPDRTWLALAAYNVGWGHLEDARILTQRAGQDPDRWRDVAAHLPLLSNPKYYNTVRFGYARGREPVHYVRNIRSYYDILTWHSARHQRMAAIPGE